MINYAESQSESCIRIIPEAHPWWKFCVNPFFTFEVIWRTEKWNSLYNDRVAYGLTTQIHSRISL